jgi:PAS domain-containing protein
MELKATQTELTRQNNILTTLQEHLAGALCVLDENKRILFFNQKFLDQWSLSREMLELNPTWEYAFGYITQSPQFLSLSDADIQHALIEEITHDQTRSLHDEIVLGDGTTLERHSTPLIYQNSVYHGRIWEFVDITERVQKE